MFGFVVVLSDDGKSCTSHSNGLNGGNIASRGNIAPH